MAGAKQSFRLMSANININTDSITQTSVEPIAPNGGTAFFSAKQNMRPDRKTVLFSINTQLLLKLLQHYAKHVTVNSLMAKRVLRCRVPITVLPGNRTDEQLDALF